MSKSFDFLDVFEFLLFLTNIKSWQRWLGALYKGFSKIEILMQYSVELKLKFEFQWNCHRTMFAEVSIALYRG